MQYKKVTVVIKQDISHWFKGKFTDLMNKFADLHLQWLDEGYFNIRLSSEAAGWKRFCAVSVIGDRYETEEEHEERKQLLEKKVRELWAKKSQTSQELQEEIDKLRKELDEL